MGLSLRFLPKPGPAGKNDWQILHCSDSLLDGQITCSVEQCGVFESANAYFALQFLCVMYAGMADPFDSRSSILSASH
jgi:hypothetical protein